MRSIQIFNNPEFGDIRTVDLNGEPWFVGKDIAAALGYGEGKSLANAVANHVDDVDKGVTEMMTPGGMQKMVIVNESGVYSLIFGSKLEGAVRFKRWVTGEVLPTLRKTGSYTMPKLSKEMQALFLLDDRTQKQEARLTALENTMTVDYSQQQTLKKAVGRVVVEALGGKAAPAYNDPPCARQAVQRVQPRRAGLVPGQQRVQRTPQGFHPGCGVHPALEAQHQLRDAHSADQRPDQLI